MTDRYLKYAFFSLMLLSAVFLAFEAGEKGVEHSKKQPSQKLFKTLPAMKEDFFNQKTQVQTENVPQDTGAEKKKKEEEKKKDPKNHQSLNRLNHEVFPVESSKTHQNPVSRIKTFGSSFNTVQATPIDRKRERKFILPQFSNVYVPAYHTSQGVMVINRQISSGSQGIQYEIHVYDESGKNFLNSFVTEPFLQFPFQGMPQFHPVDHETFTQSNRFFVFQENTPTRKLLNNEAFVAAVIQSSIQHTIDSKARVGKDPQSNLNMYQLYPGIYLGEMSLN